MKVFAAWPAFDVQRSNRQAEEWMGRGYQVAVATDLPVSAIRGMKCSIPPLLMKHYTGYYKTMNFMAQSLCSVFRADVVIMGSEGLHPPDHDRSWALAATFAAKFDSSQGFGVMLPCQEVWSPSIGGSMAQEGAFGQRRMHATPPSDDRCEGAWIGKRFALEAYDGAGPFFGDYDQYFGDVELHDVARKLGVLWKRSDVRQEREHWSRPGSPRIQPHQESNFDRAYEKDYVLWKARRAKQYPEGGSAILKKTGLILP